MLAPKRARRAKYPRRPRRVALRSHPTFSFPDLPALPVYTLPTISVLRSEISQTSVTIASEIMMRNNFEAAMERALGRAGARPSRFTSVTLNCTPPKSPHSATRRGRRGYFARRAPHTKNTRHRKVCSVSREGCIISGAKVVEKNERKSAGSNELADYLTTKRIEFSYSTGKLG